MEETTNTGTVEVTPQNTSETTTQVTTLKPAETSSSTNVFEEMSSQKPMDIKSIILFGLLIAVSIYGITYYRKAIQKLDENVDSEEFENLIDDVEEVKANVKKALGKKYQPI